MEEDLSMEKIKRDCHYLYQGLYIPMYIYKNTTLLGTWPEQEAYTLPPIPYLHRLWNTGKPFPTSPLLRFLLG